MRWARRVLSLERHSYGYGSPPPQLARDFDFTADGVSDQYHEKEQRWNRAASEVRGIISDRGYVEDRNRELLERVIAEPERYHWIQISNEDIGEPGCRHWHSRPRFGLLGMLMGWWRVRISSGCPLA